MEDVIKLPATEDKPAATKRSRAAAAAAEEAGGEEPKRQKNVSLVSVLGQEDSSVKMLEDLVFGAEDELLGRLEEQQQSAMLDREDLDQSEDEAHQQQPIRKAVWVDEDDELEEEVNMRHRYRRDLVRGEAESTMTKRKLQQRMREQFEKAMGGAPAWAEGGVKKTTEDEGEDEDDDLLRRTGNLVASPDCLPGGVLKMKRCAHANAARPSDERLTSVQFHRSAQVVMTAGLDRCVSLFQVDGKTNPKIQSIHLEAFPVHQARFSRDGEVVIATSPKNKMFYLYDMMEGRVTPVHAVRGLNRNTSTQTPLRKWSEPLQQQQWSLGRCVSGARTNFNADMSLPPQLKPIQHHLRTAQEHDKRDPVVAYYCRLYAMQTGMKLDSKSPECRKFLVKLMDQLESMKKELSDNESITQEVVGNAHIENYAIKMFLYADNEDRSGRFHKNMIKSFYTASLLMDVLSVFGELSEENIQHRKYARWKATYIHNCLKSGETPEAGPIGMDPDMEADVEGAEGYSGPAHGGSFRGGPDSYPYQDQGPGPAPGIGFTPGPDAAPSGAPPTTSYNNIHIPPGAHAPANTPAELAPPTAEPAKPVPLPRSVPAVDPSLLSAQQQGGVQLSPEDFSKAQRFCKYAGSALQYEDVGTAVQNLQKALKLLTTGKE